MGWVVSAMSQMLYLLEGDALSIVQEAGKEIFNLWYP
jgi:hypothetical protein